MPAITADKVVVELEAKIAQYENKMKRAEQTANRGFRGTEVGAKRMESAIGRSFRNSAASIALVHGPLGGVASRFSAIASLFSRAGVVGGGIAAGLGVASIAATKALKAFQAFETQQLVIEQVLRATGGAAGQTGQQIEAMAQGIAASTLASTSEVRDAASQLLTFRTVAGDTFERTLKLSQDLAAVGFGNLRTSAVQLGKALEDPANGLAALRRVGVSFSAAQRQVIQDLHDTGRTAEAQEKILDGLEKQVGGAGAASAGGLSGAYDTLSQATENLLVRWGKQIAEAYNIRAAILGIASAIDEVNARAGIAGQLQTVNEEIASTRTSLDRNRGQTGSSIFGTAAEHEEKRMEALLRRRQQLQLQFHREAEQQSLERLGAIKREEQAQKEAADERAQSVVAASEKELELAGKTATQRKIIQELAEAGVTAESELGQVIVNNLEAAAAREKALSESQKKGRKERLNDFEREAASLEEHVRLLQAETDAQAQLNPLINDYGFATEKAKAEQELLNAAMRAGLEITPELAARIDTLSNAYAGTVVAAEKLAEAQDKIKEKAEDLAEFQKNLTKGIIDGFLNGASAADTFANALKKIGDRLVNDILDNIFKINQAGSGGFLSSLFSLFTGALGGGFSLPSTAPIPTPRPLSMAAMATPLSAPPAPSMQRSSRSNDSQGVHVTVGVSADNNGNLRPFVESVSQQVTRTGLTQYDRTMLPSRVNQIARDPRAR